MLPQAGTGGLLRRVLTLKTRKMGYSGHPIGKYQIDFTADQPIYIGAKNVQ
jgi:hypothetical protein